MEDSQKAAQTVGRFYTSARRFKQVLGSLPDGTKIPGGPYTYTQVGVMGAVLVLGWMTRVLWGGSSFIGDLIMLLAVAVGAGFLVGKLPQSRRNPIKLLGSTLTLITHPGPGGHWRGRPCKLSFKAKRIQSRTLSRDKSEKRVQNASSISEPTLEIESVSAAHYSNFGSGLNRIRADQGILNTERQD